VVADDGQWQVPLKARVGRRESAERFDHSASCIYYRVDDLGAAFERLRDHELWMVFFRDPDENLLALMSEVR